MWQRIAHLPHCHSSSSERLQPLGIVQDKSYHMYFGPRHRPFPKHTEILQHEECSDMCCMQPHQSPGNWHLHAVNTVSLTIRQRAFHLHLIGCRLICLFDIQGQCVSWPIPVSQDQSKHFRKPRQLQLNSGGSQRDWAAVDRAFRNTVLCRERFRHSQCNHVLGSNLTPYGAKIF